MEKLYTSENTIFDMTLTPKGDISIELIQGDFIGKYSYIYDKINLQRIEKEIAEFYVNPTETSYEFCDTDSDSYILFTKEKYGHLNVTGQLGSAFSGTYLCFKFEADQTVIKTFLERIRNWLNNN